MAAAAAASMSASDMPSSAFLSSATRAAALVAASSWLADVKFRLEIDYETLRRVDHAWSGKASPGFSRTYHRERPGFDQIAQGMGGLMSITGLPGQGRCGSAYPWPTSPQASSAPLGILVALLEREQSGESRWSAEQPARRADPRCSTSRRRVGQSATEVPRPGRQRPSDQHSDRGVSDLDGYADIGAAGEAIYQRFKVLEAPDLATDRLQKQRGSVEEPRTAARGDRRDHPQANHGGMDRPAQPGQCARSPITG